MPDTIEEICAKPEPGQLWQDRFLRMSGQTMAGYAEQRSYYYQSEAVDRQVHLGIDIASTANAEIKAANRGKVVFADYLGIYGNMVILDHGQGVFSLYSHLSRIDTEPGADGRPGNGDCLFRRNRNGRRRSSAFQHAYPRHVCHTR